MRDVEIQSKLIPLPLLANLCNITPTKLADAAAEGKLRCDLKRKGVGHTAVSKSRSGICYATEEDLWDYVATLNPGDPAFKRAVRLGEVGRCLQCSRVRAQANPGKALCRECFDAAEVETVKTQAQTLGPKEIAQTVLDELLKRNGDGMTRNEIGKHVGYWRFPGGGGSSLIGQALQLLLNQHKIENRSERRQGERNAHTVDVWHAIKPQEGQPMFNEDEPETSWQQSDAKPTETAIALASFAPGLQPQPVPILRTADAHALAERLLVETVRPTPVVASPHPVHVVEKVAAQPLPAAAKPPRALDLRAVLELLGDALESLPVPVFDTSALERRIKALEDAPKRSDLSERLDAMQQRLDALSDMMEQTIEPLVRRSMAVAKDPPVSQAQFGSLKAAQAETEEALQRLRTELGAS